MITPEKNVTYVLQANVYTTHFVLHTNTSKITLCYESYKNVTIIELRNIIWAKQRHIKQNYYNLSDKKRELIWKKF